MFVTFATGGLSAKSGQMIAVNVAHVHAVLQRENNECLIDMGAEAYLVKGSLEGVVNVLNDAKAVAA